MALRILGVNGGIRPGSGADRDLRFALRTLERSGARCEDFDIGVLPALHGRRGDFLALRALRSANRLPQP